MVAKVNNLLPGVFCPNEYKNQASVEQTSHAEYNPVVCELGFTCKL